MNDLLFSAFEHIWGELGIERIPRSLSVDFDLMEKAHDSIHEFMYLAPLFFQDNTDEIGWQRKSAFLIYHWESFDLAHRSLIEALCAHYNVAFILLRATLETVLKGAFWQCLSQPNYRTNLGVLRGKGGERFRQWLERPLNPAVVENSAALFDEIGEEMRDRAFAPGIQIIIRQLHHWGMLDPIDDPLVVLYEDIYSLLSADVHVAPDATDVGRRAAVNEVGILERKVQPAPLRKYCLLLHRIMDASVTVELNLLSDTPQDSKITVQALSDRLTVLQSLELEYSLKKALQLAGQASSFK